MSDTPRTSLDALKAQGELVKKFYDDKIARLERELAALRADAERYRWLRDKHEWYDCYLTNTMNTKFDGKYATLDAAIDEAMRDAQKQEEK